MKLLGMPKTVWALAARRDGPRFVVVWRLVAAMTTPVTTLPQPHAHVVA